MTFSQGGQGGLGFHHFGWYNAVKGGYDIIFSRSFIGGHFEKGRGRDKSEHARLLCDLKTFGIWKT